MDRSRGAVIELRLNRAEDMFVLGQADLVSEFCDFLTRAGYYVSLSDVF